jgi:hypothetical protein
MTRRERDFDFHLQLALKYANIDIAAATCAHADRQVTVLIALGNALENACTKTYTEANVCANVVEVNAYKWHSTTRPPYTFHIDIHVYIRIHTRTYMRIYMKWTR